MTTIEKKDTCAEGFCPHVDPKKHFALIVAIVIMGMIIGSFVDSYLPTPLSNSKKSYEAGRQSGFNEAKKVVENSNVGSMVRTLEDVRTLSGTVTSVSGNQFTLRVQSSNPFDDPSLIDRIITVNASTTVFNVTQKDFKIFQNELNAFTKSLDSTHPLPSPSMYVQKNADFSSVKVGNSVDVSSEINIKTMKDFIASKIEVHISSVTPNTAP